MRPWAPLQRHAAVAGATVLAASLAACGGPSSSSPGPVQQATPNDAQTPGGTATPGPTTLQLATPGTVTLGAGDNRRTVDVPVGSTIVVRLTEKTPLYAWTVPQSSAPSVLALGDGQRQAGGGAEATFTARSAGRASLSAENDCTPSGCQGSSDVWEVDVAVSG